MSIIRIIILAVVSLVTLIGFSTSCTTIDSGEVGVVKHFGAAQPSPLKEGIHFIRPFWTATVVPINVKMQSVSSQASASSKDLQAVNTEVTMQYSVVGTLAPKMIQKFGISEAIDVNILAPAIQESVKSVTARYTAEELIKKRAEVKTAIEKELLIFIEKTLADKDALGTVRIANVAITDFQFSNDFNTAIEAKVKAEQDALKAKNEKTKRVTQAEAAAAEKKLEAEALAFKTEVESKARADAIERESAALKANPELIELRIAERWDGKLPTYTGSNAVPFINIK